MKNNYSITGMAGCFLLLLMLGCNSQKKSAPDTRAADEAAIRQEDAAWSTAAETKLMEQFYGAFLEDAVVLAPNEPMAVGIEAIRKMGDNMFAMPGFSVKWKTGTVVVAGSGDIGYSISTSEFTMNDATGAPMVDIGKGLTIWKKQADGSWKVAADMFNSDSPMPAAN